MDGPGEVVQMRFQVRSAPVVKEEAVDDAGVVQGGGFEG